MLAATFRKAEKEQFVDANYFCLETFIELKKLRLNSIKNKIFNFSVCNSIFISR